MYIFCFINFKNHSTFFINNQYISLILTVRLYSCKWKQVQLYFQHNMCLHHYSYCNTNTNYSTSTRNTLWQYTLIEVNGHLSRSRSTQYRNNESPNLITTHSNLLQVSHTLLKKTPANINKRAPVYWHLRTCRKLIPTTTSNSCFLSKLSVHNNIVSWMEVCTSVNFNIALIKLYY
jgi:hypothetical protein